MIDNDPASCGAHRLHANFVIRHAYNQPVINHTGGPFFFRGDISRRAQHGRRSSKSATHSRFISKDGITVSERRDAN